MEFLLFQGYLASFIVVPIIIIKSIIRARRNDDEETQQTITPKPQNNAAPQQQAIIQRNEFDVYRDKYQRKNLLTRNEWYGYLKLKQLTDQRNLIVCPKVRLLDLIEPRPNQTGNKSLLYKIQAKHVDFVICDTNMNVRAVLELDDRTHDRQDRKERDMFVDTVLSSNGYRVIHAREITEQIMQYL